VLVVEDNPVNQELALAMLSELGVEAVSAWGGEEALVKLAADHYEVVLMDCQMPKLDGYATTRRLREWERRTGRERTPVVALTANALNGDAARCFDAGMDRYLSKPYTIEQLHRILESCAPNAKFEPEPRPKPEPKVEPKVELKIDPRMERRAEPRAEPKIGRAPGSRIEPAVESAAEPRVAPKEERAAEPRVAPKEERAAAPKEERAAAPKVHAEVAALDERTLDRIRDLHRRGGPNLLGKMAELYLSSSRRLIDDLGQALASHDGDGAGQAAHALRSSSSSVGATILADLCEAMEAVGREARFDGSSSLMEKIVAEHARVALALDSLRSAA
jgi:CheY-like chemotaxis protein